MPTAAYTAINARSWRSDGGGRWLPNSISQDVRQGEYQGNGQHVGAMVFDLAIIRSMYISHIPTAARLRVNRTGSGSYGSAVTATLYAGNQFGIPATTNTGSVIATRPAKVSAAYNYTVSAGTGNKTLTISTALIDSIGTGASNCLFFDSGSDRYMSFTGRDNLSQTVLEVDWTPRNPNLTPPEIHATPTITEDTHTFTWATSTDISGIYTPAQLLYIVQFSEDGGGTWGLSYTTSAGVTQMILPVRDYLGLVPAQHYYNDNFRMRVMAITPTGEYLSSWSISQPIRIDFSITPSEIQSFSIYGGRTSAYEGETVTFTMVRPERVNLYRQDGTPMMLWYSIMTESGTVIAGQGFPATTQTISTSAVIGGLTLGTNNLATKVYAFVNDDYTLRSPNTPMVDFTINRFRAPLASIFDIERAETAAEIAVQITDTGYAAPQGAAQISGIYYRIGAEETGTEATDIVWDGLTARFVIPNLIQNNMYPLEIVVLNKPPTDTLLESLSSPVISGMILAHTPAFMVRRDNATGKTSIAAKGGYFGDDYTTPVDDGSVVVQNNLTVSGLLAAIQATLGRCIDISGQDAQVVRDTGFYFGGNMLHAPGPEYYQYSYVKIDDSYCNVTATTLSTNTPFVYNKYINGTWTGWLPM